MQKYLNNVTNRSGTVVPFASVLVQTLAGATATIYRDNGITVAANPLVCDADGYFEFYAADGRYSLTISGEDITPLTISDILLEDPLDGSAALAASGGSALVGFIQAGTDAVVSTAQRKLRETVSVQDFGATGDGATNDTTALQAAIDAAKAGGFMLYVPPGIYLTESLNIGGAATHWGIRGAGKKLVTFKHRTGVTTLLQDNTGTSGSYVLEGFTVNCQNAAFPGLGNHGISMLDVSGIRVRDVHVTDFKNCAILLYATTAGVQSNNQFIDVTADGLNASSNGLLMVNVDYSGMSRCGIKGVSKALHAPGYGLQFKNNCRYCFMSDSWAENCYVGLAFGNDTGTTGVCYSTISNCRVKDCTFGWFGSYSENNTFDNIYVDLLTSNGAYPAEQGFNFDTNCVGNTARGLVIENVDSTKNAVRLRSGATDNAVEIASLNNINASGRAAFFDAGAQFNTVTLLRMRNPRVRSSGIQTMASFGTDSDCNAFQYEVYPMVEVKTIASDAISISNLRATHFIIDTEAAAATDNLATVTNSFAQAGQRITLRTSNSARDVTVKHNTGNIMLNGLADFTLDNAADFLVLEWHATTAKWAEVGRGNNF